MALNLAPGVPFYSFSLSFLLKVAAPLDLLSKLLASKPTAIKVTNFQNTKANFASLQ